MELFGQTPQNNRNWWLMTELFVMLHGSDECRGGEDEANVKNLGLEELEMIFANAIEDNDLVHSDRCLLNDNCDCDDRSERLHELLSAIKIKKDEVGGLGRTTKLILDWLNKNDVGYHAGYLCIPENKTQELIDLIVSRSRTKR
uniref:Uncharacterized protein n=2 Tax=viral metagenome TaxID=1070528 RepID=A0A6H1ZLW8_9ZZZZ